MMRWVVMLPITQTFHFFEIYRSSSYLVGWWRSWWWWRLEFMWRFGPWHRRRHGIWRGEQKEYIDWTIFSSSNGCSMLVNFVTLDFVVDWNVELIFFTLHIQNSRKGRIFGLQKIGAKKIPEHVRCHKQTALEKAKATLLLATLPKSLPCRDKYVWVEDLLFNDFIEQSSNKMFFIQGNGWDNCLY